MKKNKSLFFLIRHIYIQLTILIFIVQISLAQNTTQFEFNFISIIQNDTIMSNSIGLRKLTDLEKNKLNKLMNGIYEMGYKECSEIFRKNIVNQKKSNPTNIKGSPNSDIAYISKVDSDIKDVVTLDNGAIVEITSGYLGYIGYRKTAVLYRVSNQWKIWIEGKRSYRCDILKEASYATSCDVEEAYIYEVKGDGSILEMLDGSLYQVDDYYTYSTSIWIGSSDVLILDGDRLINLDEGDEIIDVIKLK